MEEREGLCAGLIAGEQYKYESKSFNKENVPEMQDGPPKWRFVCCLQRKPEAQTKTGIIK